jgi:sugar O-acyltransferase (sialic acid O-acetyltransferase NeuD family)
VNNPQARQSIVIFGCGGHGRVIADILSSLGVVATGFLDDNPPSPDIDGVPLIGGRNRLDEPDFIKAHAIIVGVGDCAIRRRIATHVLEQGGTLAVAIHPRATIARRVTIGEGTVVMAGAVINTGSRVGRFAIVNTGAILDHDTILEDGVHISPGCHLAGNVTCGSDVFVGTGANLIPRVHIGARTVIGAGATVISDVPPDVLAAGCPASVKKHYPPP